MRASTLDLVLLENGIEDEKLVRAIAASLELPG
jgi:hypothetical protein